ncbi:MAG TPA: SDR family oxidoreductase [Balneolaceae bacterium]|nr:SDR family oxidoreductase [Balneolaceae bacterium]
MPKVAIVTGASRGIGKETCRALAQKRHTVIAVARSEEKLKDLERENPSYVKAVPTDLTNPDEINKLNEIIRNNYHGIDILVNNAGTLINKPFRELSLDDWRSQIDSNLMSAVAISKKLLPLFNKPAHVVNISSMGGFQGSVKFPGLTAYSVSKGALSIFTECLAAELKDKKIGVNALCLGAVQTEMLKEAFPGIAAPVNPGEMGEYIADFASTGHRFYNGKILPVALEDPE